MLCEGNALQWELMKKIVNNHLGALPSTSLWNCPFVLPSHHCPDQFHTEWSWSFTGHATVPGLLHRAGSSVSFDETICAQSPNWKQDDTHTTKYLSTYTGTCAPSVLANGSLVFPFPFPDKCPLQPQLLSLGTQMAWSSGFPHFLVVWNVRDWLCEYWKKIVEFRSQSWGIFGRVTLYGHASGTSSWSHVRLNVVVSGEDHPIPLQHTLQTITRGLLVWRFEEHSELHSLCRAAFTAGVGLLILKSCFSFWHWDFQRYQSNSLWRNETRGGPLITKRSFGYRQFTSASSCAGMQMGSVFTMELCTNN